jgi:signal transduction histidine kinase
VGQIVGAGVENIILNERQIHQERLAGIGEAVSGTSHDMRNILMGIAGGAEMIGNACEDSKWKGVQEGLEILNKSIHRFRGLSDSLLTYARITELNIRETDLNALVSEVLNSVEPEAQKRLISMRYDHNAPGAMLLDGQQMYRVLLNLVRNAMDAIEGDGGTIDIESGSSEQAVYIRVRDTGKGIPPEHMARIGQPFFTTKKDKGTGLGLATCYRIMEQHQGRIDVDSAPDRGTTFTLYFPPDQLATKHDYTPPS